MRIDNSSETWAALIGMLRVEIEQLRDGLESPNCSSQQADMYRGQLQLARKVIDWGTNDD